MSKNTLIIIVSIVVVMFSIALVLLLILIPQVKPISSDLINKYEQINKLDYTYIPTKDDIDINLIQEYNVTEGKIISGIRNKNYLPGNDNPFSPPSDVKNPEVDPYKEKVPTGK